MYSNALRTISNELTHVLFRLFSKSLFYKSVIITWQGCAIYSQPALLRAAHFVNEGRNRTQSSAKVNACWPPYLITRPVIITPSRGGLQRTNNNSYRCSRERSRVWCRVSPKYYCLGQPYFDRHAIKTWWEISKFSLSAPKGFSA